MNEVYYRIYFWPKIDKLTVVCMQDFDEDGYYQRKFLRDESDEKMRWDEEEAAIKYLNDNFKAEHIDPEYLSPNNMVIGVEGNLPDYLQS